MDEQLQPPTLSEQPQNEAESPQPVAYDTEGRPLYAAPPTNLQDNNPQRAPQYVHLSRAVEPVKQTVSSETKQRHDESTQRYPFLNLSEAEFIISAVRRHPIGLIFPVAMTIFFVALMVSLMINYPIIVNSLGVLSPPPYGMVLLCGALLTLLFIIGGYAAVWVYRNNTFFLTNESVIQEVQKGIFSRLEQTVSLVNIEDASFTQQGLLQNIFNYGSIRLSTEGDETTYRFDYVANPKDQIAVLNNAVEAFKNGRPVIND